MKEYISLMLILGMAEMISENSTGCKEFIIY
jgi:hypothetical protein